MTTSKTAPLQDAGEYRLGRVVRETEHNKLGHIRGFGPINSKGAITISVQWQDGGKSSVDPSRIELL